MKTSILLVLIIHLALSQDGCPKVDKCVCSPFGTQYVYDCPNLEISEIPHFPKDTVSIELLNNRIKHLPADIFKTNIELGQLSLKGNMIEILPNEVFAGNTELVVIDLGNNIIKSLPADIFRRNTKLMSVMLDENRIEGIPVGCFGNNANIIVLGLTYNLIDTLPEESFVGMAEIDSLYLLDNKIMVLHAEIFKTNTKLKSIILNENMISNLPENIFAANVNLEVLYLAKNMISHLPVGIFARNSNIQTIILEGNNISYLPENIFDANVNLQTLDLGGNPIETFYTGTFDVNSLSRVRISFNCNCMKGKIYDLILQELMDSVFEVACKGSTDSLKEITPCLDENSIATSTSSNNVECSCPEKTTGSSAWYSLIGESSTSISVIVSSGESLVGESSASSSVSSAENLPDNDSEMKSRESILSGTLYSALEAVLGSFFGTFTALTMIVDMTRKIKKLKEFEMKAEKTQKDEDDDQSSCTIDLEIIDNFSLESEVVARFSNIPPVDHITQL